MVKEFGVEAVSFKDGFCVADVRVKTDKTVVGMRVSIPLAKEDGLGALVGMVDAEVQKYLSENLGMVPEEKAATANS